MMKKKVETYVDFHIKSYTSISMSLCVCMCVTDMKKAFYHLKWVKIYILIHSNIIKIQRKK